MIAKQLQKLKYRTRKTFLTNPPIKDIEYATHQQDDKLSENWFSNFLGFVVLQDFVYGYNNYTPLYAGYNKNPLENESEEIAKENPYILMFYGSDNYSDFIRFQSFVFLKGALSKNLNKVRKNSQIHYYNS